MFLSREQLVDLTGYRQPCAQIRWLRKNGIAHFVRSDGRPVVQPAALEQRTETRRSEPKFEALDPRH